MLLVCPQVFETPPAQGAPLPLAEVSTCTPAVMPDKDGRFEEFICRETRLDGYEKNMLFRSFGQNPRAMCNRKRANKERHQSNSARMLSTAIESDIQKRFIGQLIKSRDRGQSAIETCNSKNSLGPNFYSYHEGKFCDMSSRKLYSRCEAPEETGCFDE
jgi:hypothetical protein